MNIDVFILFFNATFVTILSCVVVLWVLRKQYLPRIKEEEEEKQKVLQENGNNHNSSKGENSKW